MSEKIIISASTLDDYADCPRRWLARRVMEKPAEKSRSIGAIVGEALHDIIASGEALTEDAVLDKINPAFSAGVEWDESTKDAKTAVSQTLLMAKAFREVWGDLWSDKSAEKEVDLERDLPPYHDSAVLLRGRVDYVNSGVLRDIKTTKGALTGSYHAQMGAYGFMRPDVKVIKIHKIYRPRLSRKSPPPEEIMLDRSACVSHFKRTLKAAVKDAADYSADENPNRVHANPMSFGCRDGQCPAFGTDFCTLTKEKKQ